VRASSTLAPRSRGLLALLIVLFFAPLVLAFLMYYGSQWRPLNRTNYGTLIEPPRPLPRLSLPRADGSLAADDVLVGRWSLVYVAQGGCDASCHASLYFMRQTFLGMGNLIPRLQQVFLATGQCCDRAFLVRDHSDLLTLDAGGDAGAPWLSRIPEDARSSTLFLVDPRGNLMMRYDVRWDPKGLHEDLRKLLDLSHIG
jgi:cytochrome oxidase Cu insertion factor (SCO1/SenC/PrrC family)